MSNERPTLTTRQGHSVSDNQSLRPVGAHGPATLENYQFIGKIRHFNRKRIPERVVHARRRMHSNFSTSVVMDCGLDREAPRMGCPHAPAALRGDCMTGLRDDRRLQREPV